jgi:branched-chain amino acid aminotransferase
MKYFNFSGEIISFQQNAISTKNRAFRYADSLFESMYFTNNKIVCFEKHWKRLHSGMEALKMNPQILNSASNIEQQCIDLIRKNNITDAARIRMQIWRKYGGLYLPESNEIEYSIEVSPLQNEKFIANKNGLRIGIAESVYKDNSCFSNIKTTAKQEMIIAAMEAKEQNWDDAIILNNQGNIVEATSSNLFVYTNSKIITPQIIDGALDGIMRSNVIEIAKKLEIEVLEKTIKPDILQKSEEIFLTNAIKGIQWIKSFGQNTYGNKISTELINHLNINYIQ